MSDPPSKMQVRLARFVVGLMIVFVIAGIVLYGFSAESRARLWQNLLERPDGPMVFRFILQPLMAAVAALRGGLDDARAGRSPFMWTVLTQPTQRAGLLDEALIATARIILLGLAMDAIYQFIEFKTFHPAEAVIIALLLAFVPYVILRGLVTRVARRWVGDGPAGGVR